MSRLKSLLVFIIVALFASNASAQMMGKPVRFKAVKRQVNENTFDVLFTATIDKGWHVYGIG